MLPVLNALLRTDKITPGDPLSREAGSGIDRFGHFAGLTASLRMKQFI
jgi:hypothetical protein